RSPASSGPTGRHSTVTSPYPDCSSRTSHVARQGKPLAHPTTCVQIGERREKMNEVGAEPLIVMAEPDLNPSEGFALAPRGSDLEFEQGSQRKIIHVYMDAFYGVRAKRPWLEGISKK